MKRPPIGPRPGRHHPACGKNRRRRARGDTAAPLSHISHRHILASTSAAHVCPLPTHLRTRRLLPRKQRRGEAEHRAPRVSTWAAGRRGTDRRARRVDQTNDKKPDRAFEAAPPSPPSPSPPASSPSDGLLRLLRPHLRHAARQPHLHRQATPPSAAEPPSSAQLVSPPASPPSTASPSSVQHLPRPRHRANHRHHRRGRLLTRHRRPPPPARRYAQPSQRWFEAVDGALAYKRCRSKPLRLRPGWRGAPAQPRGVRGDFAQPMGSTVSAWGDAHCRVRPSAVALALAEPWTLREECALRCFASPKVTTLGSVCARGEPHLVLCAALPLVKPARCVCSRAPRRPCSQQARVAARRSSGLARSRVRRCSGQRAVRGGSVAGVAGVAHAKMCGAAQRTLVFVHYDAARKSQDPYFYLHGGDRATRAACRR